MKTIIGCLKQSFPGPCPIRSRVFLGILLLAATGVGASHPLLVARAQQANNAKAIVRHGFTVDGRIEGSVQQLSSEDTTLNDGAVITGDLLTPGTPTVRQHDNSSLGEVTQGSGSAQPADYEITLNGNSQLGHLVKRTDAVAVATVNAPAAASGTSDVTLSDSNQSVGDFAIVRDLTLNGGGMVAVPAGTYRAWTANNGAGFVLGVAGASQPSVYNLDSLTLNDGSQLQILGPVILTTAKGVTFNGPVGAETNSFWLTLKVASGDVTLNGGSVLYAAVIAPLGAVTINENSSLIGNIVCARLAVNAGALLRIVQ
jgi:cytoskeletal protein CcmA (bactofilin family)